MRKISKVCAVAIAVMFVVMASSAMVYSNVQDDDWINDADVRTINFGRGISLETANQLSEKFYNVSIMKEEETTTFKGLMDFTFTSEGISNMSLDSDDIVNAELESSYNPRSGFMNTSATVSQNGAIVSEDSMECSPVFYDDDTFDVIFTMDGRLVSLTELVGLEGDKEDCFLPAIIIVAGIAISTYSLATAVAVVTVVALSGYLAYDIYKEYEANKNVQYVYEDGFCVYKAGAVVYAYMENIRYEMENLTQNREKKQSGLIYLVVKYNDVLFVSQMSISFSTAQKIMKLDKGHMNTYTVNATDARKIADTAPPLIKTLSPPVQHFAKIHEIGYYDHWHVNKGLNGLLLGNSHSFYGRPMGGG